jgi:hypothetical protein
LHPVTIEVLPGFYCLGQFLCWFSTVLTVFSNRLAIKAKSSVKLLPRKQNLPVPHDKNEKKTLLKKERGEEKVT